MILKGAAPIIRKQLIAFGIAAVVGAVVLAVSFLRVPEQLGIGRHTVSAEFAQAAGLYTGAEVTYLGHPVGKVEKLNLAGDRMVAEFSLVNDVDIPATVTAEIHSRSAVGEQYVSLVPDRNEGKGSLLADGDVIPLDRTSYPVEIGPVLDNVQALVSSLDEEKLSLLIDESGQALSGRAGDLQALLDSGSNLIETADANFRPTADLLRDLGPVLGTINGEREGIARLTRNLDQVTAELRAGDADLRKLLADGPAFTTETIGLIDDLSISLPTLLQRTNPVLGTLRTYNGHLAQILSDYPLAVATVQSVTLPALSSHAVRLTLANADKPPVCVKGFVPAGKWASPFDDSPRTTPLSYCKLPSNDPRGVRGARNIPCPADPGRREGDATRC
ncbi:MCE family protein [Nocardioides sp. WS12]|uniref:MCE family protein n=1 Tax=Nocardioides sp. WS12 TaxID=2486272 RepID=UPI0015FDB403|nr:MCE family protein [Nocardioides sp. WS12]